VRELAAVPLAQLTTLQLGGPARRLVEAEADDEVVETVRAADAAGEPLLVMGAGSNLVVAAGEPWDAVVAHTVAQALSGIECLSGIPGLTGATPIQNVGAYGQDVAQTIVSVRAYDREAGEILDLRPEQCGFGYRTSAFKHSARHVVLGVGFRLERSTESRPVTYPELARVLEVRLGERAPLAAVREAVIALRRSKGMVLDPADPDSVSAGSFFLNPILAADEFTALEQLVRERLGDETSLPGWPEQDGATKVSSAWLIEHAGFHRGYGDGRAGISSKHTLALINRGGASASDVVALARELRDAVRLTFGVTLEPEPRLVGIAL
jgi:UDP-N-acetylmuramate dehydrogenase